MDFQCLCCGHVFALDDAVRVGDLDPVRRRRFADEPDCAVLRIDRDDGRLFVFCPRCRHHAGRIAFSGDNPDGRERQ